MESTSGGSSKAGGAGAGGDTHTPTGNGNLNVSWSTARRSSRKAPDRCQGEAATRLGNPAPRSSTNMQKEAMEEGQHLKSKQIKTSASASPMLRDSSTTSSSKGCAKRRRDQAADGNTRSSFSKKCKRMDTKRYIALFKPPTTNGVVSRNAKQASMPTKPMKIKKSPFQKLQRLPNGCHPDFDNDHLCAVNKLREFWHKSQGACLIDDKAEFKCFAPSINVVVYDGDKEMRKSIRDLKFNTNRGSMVSHVVLARPHAILEDIETVQCSSWEAVIVEYCQNSVLGLLKQLKQLPTDCRIVLLSSPPEDNIVKYRNLVAFLSSEEKYNGDYVNDNALAVLKNLFACHVAYERKAGSSNLLEYWVPAYLSKVQLQLYSSILLTNSSVLQSQVETNSAKALGDIIQCLWKCCDHPCLVDELPDNSLVNIDDETESTDNRISASGKLLLLEKMLREFRNKESRVIVLFQYDGHGENKIGTILEEFVHHRFGPESYERVQSHSTYSKKQAAMSLFNDRTKGRFVFLIENYACNSSIHLSSIDAVIIYGSDWNPLNDLKAIENIKIEPWVDYLSIFRLYTPLTVEEKGLLLAKQGVLIDCKIQDIVPSLSHCLLSWGVSILFSRLDELHQDYPSSKNPERGTLCMDKVISEFLTILSTNSNGATISKVYMSGEFYSRNITLIGEREGASSLDEDPPRFWLKLLDGKSLHCHLAEPPQVKHRRLQNIERLTNGPDEETNKGKVQPEQTSELSCSSSKSSYDVRNNGVSPEIPPSSADLQSHNDTRQKLGMGNLSTPKSLHVQLKCELSKLIKVLELPDNVRFLAEQLLEYLLKSHLVVWEPCGILHAFNIALCWRAASFLKYNKLDRRDSLALAASSLNYEHNEELARVFYKKLATLKEKVQHKPDENSSKVENCMVSSEASSSTNQRNCHMFSKQAVDLHGVLKDSSPQESSSGVKQIVSDGEVVSALEANSECQGSSVEHRTMIIKKRIDLFDKVCSVRGRNIHEKQQREISNCQTYKENHVMKLKEVCSLVIQHIQRSGTDEGSRNDQTKLIIEWFTMLRYAFLEHMRLQINKLNALQSKILFKEGLMIEKLRKEVESGQLDQCLDLCTTLPDSSFVIEEFIHFKKQNDDYHIGKSLGLGCDQLLDDRLIMEITLVRKTVPSEAISTRPVGNKPAEIFVSSNGASASEPVYLPENNINCTYSNTVPECHGNQLSNLSSQQNTDASSKHQPAEADSMGMLSTQVEQDLCPDTQPSTSLLDVKPQSRFTDDRSQAGYQLDKATDISGEDETEYPTCATHNLDTLSLCGEAESDNSQKSVPAQQSKSSCAQENLGAFQHPPEEAASAGIFDKLPPDDLHQLTSVQDQSAEDQSGMLGITEARDLQHQIQQSMTTQDDPLERADLSCMFLTQNPTVLHNAEPSGDLHGETNLMPEIQSVTPGITAAPNLVPEIQSSSSMQDGPVGAERPVTSGTIAAQVLQPETQSSVSVQHIPPEGTHSGTSGITAAPNLMHEIQSSSSMPDGLVGAERPGTSGTIAARVLQPETQSSVPIQHIPPEGTHFHEVIQIGMPGQQSTGLDSQLSISVAVSTQHIPPEGIHSDDMIQIGLPAQQSTGLDSQPSVAASCHQAEQEEPAGVLGMVVADAFEPSMLVHNQTTEAEQAGSDAVATQDSNTELLPSSTMHDVPCEETDLCGMFAPQGTIEVSRDTHAEREPANDSGTLVAHKFQSGMQPSFSAQDQPAEAEGEGAGQSDTIAAQDLQPGMQSSTATHHITPERTHPDERIQMSPQPNETPSQTSLQPNEAPSPHLLHEFFSVGPAAFNQLVYSSEPLRNELEKLKYCITLLTKSHERKKLLLQAEYNKELEEVKKKYKSLHDKEDSTYHQKREQLDDIFYKVSINQSAAENFHEKLMKPYASQERSASPVSGQVPQTSQQASTRTSGVQTTAAPVASLSATRPPLSSFHSTGPLRPEAIELQTTVPGNLYSATPSPVNAIPLRNGSYGAAGAQPRGPAPHVQHLHQMPQPYATVHRDQQQLSGIGPGFTPMRHPVPGTWLSPVPGVPMTSASSSVRQTMASASNSNPALPAPSLLSGSFAGLMGNFVPTRSTNPVGIASQQVSTVNLDGTAGIWHTGAHTAGVTNPVPESALETVLFQRRWPTVTAGGVLPSVAPSSCHPSTSNSQPALAANPFLMAGQQGPSRNVAFCNNSVPSNAAEGLGLTGTHVAVADQPVPESSSMNARPAGRSRTGVSSEPTNAVAEQRGGVGEVVCLSDED